MGILSRMSSVFKAKVNRVLDNVENPNETLDLSYERQLELLQKVRRGLADVVTSKKQVELQVVKLQAAIQQYDAEAKKALSLNREDLAKQSLEKQTSAETQLQSLQTQLDQLNAEQSKLAAGEQRLATKVASFRTQKEVIKAQYSAADAEVRIGEATSGISEEMADVGMAVQRAQDKTDRLKSRASAINELVDDGSLQDPFDNRDPVQRELDKASQTQSVDDRLAKLKAEMGK